MRYKVGLHCEHTPILSSSHPVHQMALLVVLFWLAHDVSIEMPIANKRGGRTCQNMFPFKQSIFNLAHKTIFWVTLNEFRCQSKHRPSKKTLTFLPISSGSNETSSNATKCWIETILWRKKFEKQNTRIYFFAHFLLMYLNTQWTTFLKKQM